MGKYFVRYILQIIPTLLIISFIVFILMYVTGDPVVLMLPDYATPQEVQALREALGLDKPFYVQYWIYVTEMLQGNFGTSYSYHADALDVVLERLPKTFLLGSVAALIAIGIAIPLGILSAIYKNTFFDLFITGSSVLTRSMPSFWLGIMLILLLAVAFPVFPVSGSGSWKHLVLPAITLGLGSGADMTRLVRSQMVEILGQDYIRTARSKGLANIVVVLRHGFRNCLVTVITVMAMHVSGIVGGALITETIFAWPGMGQLLVNAVQSRDMALVQAVVFVIAFAIIIMNFLADFSYRLIDPRIQYGRVSK